ncbi:hypothetical protein L1887_32584 [Cichorium endivia]|nr:hypothetical protein L1887_32584 [Cichorium endivia]
MTLHLIGGPSEDKGLVKEAPTGPLSHVSPTLTYPGSYKLNLKFLHLRVKSETEQKQGRPIHHLMFEDVEVTALALFAF